MAEVQQDPGAGRSDGVRSTALSSLTCTTSELLISIYFHRVFRGCGHTKQISIFIINPNSSLPPTGSSRPQSRAAPPPPGSAGRLPARLLQVMACEMTGLLLVGTLAGGPAAYLWSCCGLSPGLDTYKYTGKVSLLKQTMM